MLHLIESFDNILKSLWGIMSRRQKRLCVLVLLLSVLSAVFQVFSISLFIPFLSLAMNTDNASLNPGLHAVMSFMGLENRDNLVFIIGLLIWVAFIFKNIFEMINTRVRIIYSQKIRREFAEEMLNYYYTREYDYFVTVGKAQIMKELQQDTTGLNSIIYSLLGCASEMFVVTGVLLFISIQDWRMVFVIAMAAAVYLLIVLKIYHKRMRSYGIKLNEDMVDYSRSILEAIEGYKEVKMMGKQEFFMEEFFRNLKRCQKSEIVLEAAAVDPSYIVEAVFVTFLMAYVLFVAGANNDVSARIPTLAAFAAGAIRVLPSLGRIASGLNNITACLPYLHNATKMSNEISSTEGVGYVAAQDEIQKPTIQKALSLEHVSWKYESGEKCVLEDVSLVIPKGAIVGVIGESGAGKTTFADIILGIHQPQSGHVMVDGVNIASCPKSWSNLIGFVSQDVYLSDTSIRRNVAYGIPDDEIDDAQIWSVLEKAQISTYIRTLPDGINTMVGDRGVRFSGGQRQRIVIARALYRNPQLLVLDEATSALDNDTEDAIMESIGILRGDITMIIIAHRLTTVRECDVIYEVKDAKLIKRDKDDVLQYIKTYKRDQL